MCIQIGLIPWKGWVSSRPSECVRLLHVDAGVVLATERNNGQSDPATVCWELLYPEELEIRATSLMWVKDIISDSSIELNHRLLDNDSVIVTRRARHLFFSDSCWTGLISGQSLHGYSNDINFQMAYLISIFDVDGFLRFRHVPSYSRPERNLDLLLLRHEALGERAVRRHVEQPRRQETLLLLPLSQEQTATVAACQDTDVHQDLVAQDVNVKLVGNVLDQFEEEFLVGQREKFVLIFALRGGGFPLPFQVVTEFILQHRLENSLSFVAADGTVRSLLEGKRFSRSLLQRNCPFFYFSHFHVLFDPPFHKIWIVLQIFRNWILFFILHSIFLVSFHRVKDCLSENLISSDISRMSDCWIECCPLLSACRSCRCFAILQVQSCCESP